MDPDSDTLTGWCSRPVRLLLLVAVSMYLAETVAGVVFRFLPPFSPRVHVLMEGILHTVAVGPVLYLFLFRPMRSHLCARRLAEADLRRAQDELEERVARRKAELAQANEALQADIAALKGAEEKLRQSEAQYRLLFEHNPHPMWILDVETLGFLAVNEAAIEHYGYSSEEFRRITLTDISPPDDVPAMRVNVARVKADLDRVGVWRHRKKDGTIIFAEITVHALKFNGRWAELVLARDVTEPRRAREDLEREHKRLLLLNEIVRAIADHQDLPSLFRVVLKHLEDHLPIDLGSVMLSDPQDATLTLVARGPASCALAAKNGWPKENDVLTPMETGLAHCLSGETVYWRDTLQTDLSIPRRYGQAGLRSILGVPLRVGDRTIGVLAVARRGVDAFSEAEREFLRQLSEHVALAAAHTGLLQNLQRAYDDLHQSQQTAMQQERLRALGQMASGIAHDINNALTPIVGFSDLLLLDESVLDAEQKHCLQAIKTSGRDIASTVARMREFYRQRGDTEDLCPVDLNQLVRQTIDLTRPRWRDIPQQHGRVINVEPELAEGLAPIPGSESELREALTNLVINSVDAMPEGGTIHVRTRQDDGEIRLEVSDTGTGMDAETRKRCLEPFYTTKGERGTGLGLAMVYGTVQRHEGRIEIESELKVGTTIRLVFPRREMGPGSQSAVESARRPRGLRLLVVDDDPLVGDGVLKLMLQKDDHQVTVADGGEAGISMFREAVQRGQAFDAVLTDLGMPYVDGRQVARSIKAESPQTPVILVTGWGAQLQAEGDIPAGIDAVLDKPIRIKDLRRALAKVFPPATTSRGPELAATG